MWGGHRFVVNDNTVIVMRVLILVVVVLRVAVVIPVDTNGRQSGYDYSHFVVARSLKLVYSAQPWEACCGLLDNYSICKTEEAC